MVTEADFVEIPITDNLARVSLWMAERRIMYEYPFHSPEAFGAYDEEHIPVIQKGIIGELATFDHLHNILVAEHGDLPPGERWQSFRDKLCLQNHVGCFDEGSDITIMGQTLDVKVYVDRELTRAQMMSYNLFVSVNEVRGREPAGLYIQAFLTSNNSIVLAGYHQGLPSQIRRNIPTPAHYCPVRQLRPIAELADLVLS